MIQSRTYFGKQFILETKLSENQDEVSQKDKERFDIKIYDVTLTIKGLFKEASYTKKQQCDDHPRFANMVSFIISNGQMFDHLKTNEEISWFLDTGKDYKLGLERVAEYEKYLEIKKFLSSVLTKKQIKKLNEIVWDEQKKAECSNISNNVEYKFLEDVDIDR